MQVRSAGTRVSGSHRGLGMGGTHTAAGIGLPRRYMFLTVAHGSVPTEAAATSEAADARTATMAARRAMAGGGCWKKGKEGERNTRQNKEGEREGG